MPCGSSLAGLIYAIPPLSFCLANSAFAWIRLRSASAKVAAPRIFRNQPGVLLFTG
jgi:hypothetical protein